MRKLLPLILLLAGFQTSAQHICVDTLMYTTSKTTVAEAQSCSIPDLYVQVAQRYEAPTTIDIHGVCYYAYTAPSAGAPAQVQVHLYDVDGTTDLPGTALATVGDVIPLGSGTPHTDFRRCVTFPAPVTVSSDFYVAFDGSGTNEPVGITRNSFSAEDGNLEALSAVYFDDGSGAAYVRWYNQTTDPAFTSGSPPNGWNYDYLIEPIVSYSSFHNSLSTDTLCVGSDLCVQLDSTDSVLVHKMYDDDLAYPTITTDWGDGSTSSGDSVCHIYSTQGNYTIVRSISHGWDTECLITDTLMVHVAGASSGTDVQTACGPFVWIDGNTYTTSNNTATDTLINAVGCDSVITLNLTISVIDTNVTPSGFTLTADMSGANYQWIDCDNGNAAISGATNQSYTATANGNYAVVVDDGTCADTSDCHSITGIGIEEPSVNKLVNMYPNPNYTGQLHINYDGVVNSVEVYDQTGRLLESSRLNKRILDLGDLSTGSYVLKIYTDKGQAIKQLIYRRD